MGKHQRKRLSLRDIAEAAGVSRMTVSLALRNDRRLPECTRERIKRIADEMGYKPDPKVAELLAHIRKGRSRKHGTTIAFLITWPEEGSPFVYPNFRRRWEGAKRRAGELGYALRAFRLRDEAIPPERLSRMLWNRGIQGILLGPLCEQLGETSNRCAELKWDLFTAVTLSHSFSKPRLDCIEHDHFRSVRMVYNRLHAKGYRRIGLAMERHLDIRTDHRWLGGFLTEQHANAEKAPIPPLLLRGSEVQAFQQWLETWEPDAIIGINPTILRLLGQLSVRVPQDVAYAHLDLDEHFAGVSGVDQVPERIGREAIDLLVGRIHQGEHGPPDQPVEVTVCGVWVDGTTAPGRHDNER